LFLAGIGEYWYDERAFHFLRNLVRDPIVIPFVDVTELRTGALHCGQWAGGIPIVKFLWRHVGLLLISGFILSRERATTGTLVNELRPLAELPDA
jgi:hypothetical protein